MRRAILTLSLIAAPLAAQQQAAGGMKVTKDADPTIKVKSEGLPAGWTVRLDDKETRYTADDTRFVAMGSGWHVTSGPAALYYSANHMANGNYTVSASLTQTKAPTHPEAYGIFVGGRALASPQQEYFYFLVRGDGKYFVAHRAGAEVHRIVPWTEHAAVAKQDAEGKSTNVLAVQSTPDSLHLMANGQRVKSFAKADTHGFNYDGQAGLRVNHNLDIHVGSFEIRKD